ncbi:MAG: MFS transporter, partial [Gemmata sp.]
MLHPPPAHQALLARRPYVLFLAGRFFGTLANGAQAVVIGWEVYAIARRTMPEREAALLLGFVGLVEFLPVVALTLIAGETADRYNRRLILVLCYGTQLLTAAGLALRSAFGDGLWPVFALAALFGASRAFFHPTASALGPMLVPAELLPRAIATKALAVQLAAVAGPALGGLMCAVSPAVAYGACAALYGTAAFCAARVRSGAQPPFDRGRSRYAQIREGLGYVWHNKVVLGAISLDLFAVLLGGATALLPVFAREVLHVGPGGFGALRAAPAVGALVV